MTRPPHSKEVGEVAVLSVNSTGVVFLFLLLTTLACVLVPYSCDSLSIFGNRYSHDGCDLFGGGRGGGQYLEEDRRRVAAAAKEARASRRKEERQLKEYVHTLEVHLDQVCDTIRSKGVSRSGRGAWNVERSLRAYRAEVCVERNAVVSSVNLRSRFSIALASYSEQRHDCQSRFPGAVPVAVALHRDRSGAPSQQILSIIMRASSCTICEHENRSNDTQGPPAHPVSNLLMGTHEQKQQLPRVHTEFVSLVI